MNRSQIRSFVEAFLKHRGAQVKELSPALLEVALPADAAAECGEAVASPVSLTAPPGARRLLAFGTRVHRRHPEAELVAVGSAYLDHLVGEAASSGRYTISFREPPKKPGRPPRLDRLPEVSGARWGRPKPAYRPLFLFVYVAEYRTIDVPDDLELIPLDPARGEVLSSAASLIEGLRSGMADPPEGWLQITAFPTPGALRQSLTAVDRRLQRRARRVKEAAALEIARETANIEAYYRQLVDEVRHPVGRGRHSTEAETGRVRKLQLDWKRRVQEVARFWEAGASVRLSALGVVMEPCWAIPLRGRRRRRGSRGHGPICLAAEYKTGALLEPRCPACGARIRKRAELAGADLVCPSHIDMDEVPVSAG